MLDLIARTSKEISPALLSLAQKLIFFLGLFMFLSLNFALNFIPLQNRAAPVEPDDAYTLIQQSPQMESCFFQDCPALNDLRDQLQIGSANEQVSVIRDREYKSTFLIWHPLYSVLLSSLHAIGISWESAYNLIMVLGGILLPALVAYWLFLIFGNGGAGIALILLSIQVFQGPGFNLMFPKTMALFIAMVVWSQIIARAKANPWVLPGATTLMVALHPMGQIYGVMSIGLYCLLYLSVFDKWPWKAWFPILTTALLITLPFVLPLLTSRPELSTTSIGVLPADFTIVDGVIANASVGLERVHNWISNFWPFSQGILLMVPVLIVGSAIYFGFSHLAPTRKVILSISGGSLLGFLVLSIFYYLPGYPGYIFDNIWPLVVALFSGLLGHAFWVGTEKYLLILKKPTPLSLLAGIFVAFIVLASFFQYVAYNSRNYGYTIESRITGGQILLDLQQPELLLNNSTEDEDVLYINEILMHFFFTHGALNRGAIYFPAIYGTTEEEEYVAENSKIHYVVTWNPIRALAHEFQPWETGISVERQGMLLILPGNKIYLRAMEPTNLSALNLLIETEDVDPNARIRISVPENKRIAEIALTPHDSAWHSLEQESVFTDLIIEIVGTEQMAYLGGIRVGEVANLFWPWDQGISVSFDYSEDGWGPLVADFSTSAIFPGESQAVEIQSDHGSSVLAKITR